jgi:nitroimidazol reductase NimA-like FMN-containing flavoprotein (pyridoxamine 5'-phosphate oxidase superfamily)
MINKEKVFYKIQCLLNSQYFGVLATQSSDCPYCSLVGYATTPDYKKIIFATIRETHKFKNLKKSSNVSMLIDNQTNQVNDFKEAEALTVLGKAREVDAGSNDNYLAFYLKKHPHLKEFVTAPNCALIEVNVSKYILVNNFQNVMEYKVL